jgi:hypothetical protein
MPAIVAALGPLIALIRGPLLSIIEKLVMEKDAKEQLKAEIVRHLAEHDALLHQAQRDVIITELTRGSWLARSWRPLLMFLVMGIITVYGLILPLIETLLGQAIGFTPRWHDIPEGLWNLITLGVTGYIGGRSLEKVFGKDGIRH